VGVSPQDVPRKPSVEQFKFASSASAEQLPGAALTGNSTQVLAFFDYRQASGVQRVRWVVLRNGQPYYQSAAVPWAGGDHGTWWVGVPVDNARGSWEIQIYFDDLIVGTGKLQLS